MVRPRSVHLGIASGDPPLRPVTSRTTSMALVAHLSHGGGTADCRQRGCRAQTTTRTSHGVCRSTFSAVEPRRARVT
jgi:hypothetical protein